MFKVCWRNTFDSLNKYINFVLKNRLINDIYSLLIVEKPKENIELNTYFRIILQISNKTTSKFILSLTYILEHLKLKISSDKLTDKDLELIDIVERVFIII